jgi:hypothetical protein
MNIDMGDIKSFVTVAELKSITAAANKLNYLKSINRKNIYALVPTPV